MPRKARVVIENAYYHIITRGNQKQSVFKEARVDIGTSYPLLAPSL